jgi:hypothetical protein
MLQRQRLSRPTPHTMLRIVFVAVDRTDEEHSVTHSHDAQGLGLTADAVHYLRALLRCSLGPLGRVRIASLMGGRARCTGGGTKRRLQEASATCRSLCRAGPTGANYISRSPAFVPAGPGGRMRAGTRRPSPCRVSIGRASLCQKR